MPSPCASPSPGGHESSVTPAFPLPHLEMSLLREETAARVLPLPTTKYIAFTAVSDQPTTALAHKSTHARASEITVVPGNAVVDGGDVLSVHDYHRVPAALFASTAAVHQPASENLMPAAAPQATC